MWGVLEAGGTVSADSRAPGNGEAGLWCGCVVATNAGEAANMGDVEGLRSVQKRCNLAKSKCNMVCFWVGGYPQLLCVMCYGSSTTVSQVASVLYLLHTLCTQSSEIKATVS